MKRNFLNTKNIVIGLVSLVLIGASATGVTVFLKNRGEAEAAQEQVQNLPTTGNDNQEQNNPGTPAENPSDPEIPGTPVEPTTPGTTTPVEPTIPGSTTTRPSTGTTTPSREEISQGIEETVRIERQKVFEDLQLSWTTIGIPAITANMGIFKPELQIEKTVAAVVKAGESEQIPVTENNKPMVRAGDTVIYTIQVSNLGNYKATNVVVTDSLDVIFDGKTVPANQELAKIETLDAGKVATLKVGYIVKQVDIDAVEVNEQNETVSKDIINIAIATDGKTTVEDDDDMPVNPDVTINVNKNWQDNNNQDGKRPEKITVKLYRNNENEPIKTATIDASSEWKYVFSNLPKYDENKQKITYRVVEVTVPEYNTEYEISDNEVEIYNHHTPEKVSVEGSKTWDDASNQDGKKPESIMVRLFADGTEVTSKTVTANDNWSWSFTDLDKYNSGTEIVYTISEDTVTDYTTVVDGYNITNTHTPEKTIISGSKTWDDEENQDGKRPSSITVRLLADGTEVTSKTVTANDNWSWSFTDLDKYNSGTEIVYTISEDTVADYTTVVDGYNITNTHTPEKISISGSKTWDDEENQDGKRPSSITVRLLADGTEVTSKTVTATENWAWSFTDLDKYKEGKEGKEIKYTVSEDTVTDYTTVVDGYNITNTHTPEKTTVSGSKTWDDANNQDGKRPGSITVNLLADGEKVASKTVTATENWAWSFTDLDKYKEGKEIKYTVSEDTVTDYTTVVDGYNITNTHTPEKTTVSGSKTWDDANNQDGKRPGSITVNLLADGEKVASKTVTATENWAWSFTDLDKYKEGKEIKYTVSEDTVTDYTTVVDGYNITNTHTPEKTTVSGSKTWDDANNQDGKRPGSITVNLLADGEKVASKTVTATENWAWSFTDLDKYKEGKEGKEIKYTVSEDTVTDYTTVVDGYNITNTHTPEKTTVSGSKTWDDANNQDGKRPGSITVNLLADGEKVASKTVTATENWAWSFTDLDKYKEGKEGKEIKYTVSEDTVTDYTTVVDGYNITNTHTPEKTTVSGSKTWVDLDSSTRPSSITVRLLADGAEVASETVTAADGWKWSFTDLDKYKEGKEGKEIKYTVSEDTVTDYTTVVDGYNITNTIAQELISISGSKIWIAPAGTEHPEIVIGIKQNKDVYYKDGKPYTITLPKNTQDSVDYTFTDLPRYTIENGKVTENEYEIYEVTDLADYNTRKQTLRLEDGTIKQNIVNTLKEIDAKVKFRATKNWVDEGTEATREDIKVNLYKNEDKKATATKTIAKGETSCTFDNLPKYDVTTDSEGYVVSITENSYYVREEKAVEGYEAPQYSNVTSNSAKTEFYQTITNTIKQSTIDIPVEKIWNTAKGIVKPKIKFTLKMNGETYNKEDGTPYTITLENGTFTGTFTNLPKYKQANGKLDLEDGKVVRNEYTVVEEELSGYTSESKYENGKYTFTNTAKGIVKVTKHSSTATTDTVPVDVVLMLDVSGSMLNNNGKDKEPQSRAENMVSAVNSAISTIMAKNQNNRVSVVAFSSTNKDNNRKSYAYTNTIVLLPLAHYPTRNEYLSYSDDDDWDWEYTNYGKDWRYTKVNSAKISVIGTNKEISVTGGTYTQTGIYEGAMQLINTSDVTYTKGEGYDTVTRIPIMMLLTDGLPTYASTTWNGKPTNKADVKDNDNNPGANTTADEAYYTIRTAKHFKGEVGKHYKNTDAKFYTIGFGVDSKDKLANAILNPTATNINNCQGYGTAGSLYNKVMSNDQKTAGQYSYADGSYIGSMDTGTLTEIMNSFINANTKVTEERIMTEEELTGKIINLDNIDIEKEFKISYKTADGTKEYNFSEAKTAGLVKTDDKGATYYVDLNGVDITGQIIIAYNEKTVNS